MMEWRMASGHSPSVSHLLKKFPRRASQGSGNAKSSGGVQASAPLAFALDMPLKTPLMDETVMPGNSGPRRGSHGAPPLQNPCHALAASATLSRMAWGLPSVPGCRPVRPLSGCNLLAHTNKRPPDLIFCCATHCFHEALRFLWRAASQFSSMP